MAYPPNVWNQLKGLKADEIIRALKKDGWAQEERTGATLGFVKGSSARKRVVVHYHPNKTYGAKLLQGLLDDIGWTEDDMRRLKLIK